MLEKVHLYDVTNPCEFVRCTSPVCVCVFVCSDPEVGLRVCREWSCCIQEWATAFCPGKISLDFRLCRPIKPTVEVVLEHSMLDLSAFSPSRDIWERKCSKSSSTSVSATWPRSSCPRRGPPESPSLWPLCFDPVCSLDGFFPSSTGGRSSNSGMEC